MKSGARSISSKNNSILPDANLDVEESNLRLFWYWIFERHSIYHRRFIEKKKAPWTKDSLLRDFKFTNVYRELDNNSQYLINNVILNDDFSIKDRVFKCIIYRFFNRNDVWDKVGKYAKYRQFDHVNFLRKISEFDNPFCKAYFAIPSPVTMALGRELGYYPKGKDYQIGIINLYISSFMYAESGFIHKMFDIKTPEKFIKEIRKIPFLYEFLAYELYCDFDYFNPEILKFNQNDYVNIGPGCQTGIRLIFPNRSQDVNECKEVIYHLRDNQKYYFDLFGFSDFPYLKNKYGKLTLREIEHSLCEFQKYWKMIHQIGKKRQKFVPKTKVV
jgi:hypothetical protein